MRHFNETSEKRNKLHQQQFANSLVQSLGRRSAIKACVQNLWYGTLKEIEHNNHPHL